jgi:glycosyltransferase involved in cell wall biosynthesis
MNAVFCWTGVTPAMIACWRAFASLPGVRLKLMIELPHRSDTAFDARQVLAGLDYTLRFSNDPLDRLAIDREMAAFAPDVILVLGWRSPMCRAVAESPVFRSVPKIFAFDMTFRWTFRKLLAPLVLWRYLRRFAAALVTGSRSAAYARFLGFPARAIETGLIGLDTAAYAAARQARPETDRHPKQFLYVGRYAPEKRIDLLVAAYECYRGRVADPWGLTCAGMGPQKPRLAGRPGITDLGFVQPAEMPGLFARHGCFVIASDYDPWPLVIAEALASGMPVVCTDACGSHVELIKPELNDPKLSDPEFNGVVCRTGDVEGLARAMEKIHAHSAELPAMASRCQAAAAPYAADTWATRFRALCERGIHSG